MEDTTIEDVLKTVETFYARKEYQKALELLEANREKISSGLWHYNMGTVHAELGNLPLARYHLQKAELEGFSSKEVINNKELVEERLEISRLEQPLTGEDYIIQTGLTGAQGIFMTISICLIIVGIIALWKKSSIKTLLGTVFLALIFMGLNFWVTSWDKKIVMKTQPVHEGPSAIFEARSELPPGLMIVTEKKGEWLKIIYPSRFKGWIKETGLKEL